ncbi:MAG TPA: leucyl/phenylalanyl-tRNA--protein transferase [Gammaproteobacteria bacterium]|nr:leucyl/phenylalanyl-tRNA--protein transferase [Gammaproteobacteria bacterium]
MQLPPLRLIRPRDPPEAFPDPRHALQDPDGLLAVGGDLTPARLLYAYRHGIFPWYHADQPILWWSPDPRAVLFPAEVHVSRSLHRRLAKGGYVATLDTAFTEVMEACAGPRPQQPEGGTWISPAMQGAYAELHRLGHAHSVEIRMEGELAGGLYGIGIGKVFFGESMFSRRTDASKLALVHLARQLQAWGYALIDCQVHSEHLRSLGSLRLPRPDFLALLAEHCATEGHRSPWRFDAQGDA